VLFSCFLGVLPIIMCLLKSSLNLRLSLLAFNLLVLMFSWCLLNCDVTFKITVKFEIIIIDF
jgi:hypothetical protein